LIQTFEMNITKKTNPKTKKIFFIETNIHESVEGLNSSLALAAAWRVMAKNLPTIIVAGPGVQR